jgi:alpha-glucosidase (family GH31 glycosyl hydrolase)
MKKYGISIVRKNTSVILFLVNILLSININVHAYPNYEYTEDQDTFSRKIPLTSKNGSKENSGSNSLPQGYTTPGNLRDWSMGNNNKATFHCENATVQIQFCTPDIIRVRMSPDKKFPEKNDYMVIRKNWSIFPVQSTENEAHISFATGKLQVLVTKQPFGVAFYNNEGDLISSDLISNSSSMGWKDEKVRCVKAMGEQEHFFGYGERMDYLDWRGREVSLNVGRGKDAYNIHAANYCPIPFFMSTRGYGIFLRTSRKSHWDMGKTKTDRYSFSAEGGDLDYYFINGPDFKKILDRYTNITGKSPLIPRLAFGLNFGTYSGGSFHEGAGGSPEYALKVARNFRQNDIPCDVYHFDSSWRLKTEHGGAACTYEWNPNFRNPEKVIQTLHELNYGLVGVHLRSLLDNGNRKKLLTKVREKGHTVNENGLILDFFDEQAVDWWWKNCMMPLKKQGIQFVKPDAGNVYPHPEKHNLFPLVYDGSIYKKFQEHTNRRGFILAREGYAGVQRFPYIFAGDWPSEWKYYEAVVRGGLNIGLSGVGYWGHCMGGFERNATNELYIRWVQFGMLSPMAHLFGSDLSKRKRDDKEPWHYSKKAQRLFKKYDRLRYRLLPYLYTMGYRMYQTGLPLMRALVLEYQDDPNVYGIDDQYLLGSEIMVAPVLEKGAESRDIYLPEGEWIDYWTGKHYQGEQTINYPAPLERLPLLVKAGAIIPMHPAREYIGREESDSLILKVYPEKESSFEIYQDDGWTLD